MKVYLGIPTYDGTVHAGNSRAVLQAAMQGYELNVRYVQGSLLCRVFNTLWAEALNWEGCERFVMLHSDVQPLSQTWLADLLLALDVHGLDVLSLAIPIKDGSGDTSTALHEELPRRLKPGEIGNYCPNQGYPTLLINTGCMAVNFTKPWVREFPGFNMRDRIVMNTEGKFEADGTSEDWMMSRWLASHDIPYGATAEIPVRHYGPGHWDLGAAT